MACDITCPVEASDVVDAWAGLGGGYDTPNILKWIGVNRVEVVDGFALVNCLAAEIKMNSDSVIGASGATGRFQSNVLALDYGKVIGIVHVDSQ